MAPISALSPSTAADVAAAVARARRTQYGWSMLRARERAQVSLQFRELLLRRSDEIHELLRTEVGKSRAGAVFEVVGLAGLAQRCGRYEVRYLRQGVVGVFGPWRSPLSLTVGSAIEAIAGGNGAVVKADLQCVHSVLWAVDQLEEAGLPAGLLQVVTGPGSVVDTALIDHADYVRVAGRQGGRRARHHAALL